MSPYFTSDCRRLATHQGYTAVDLSARMLERTPVFMHPLYPIDAVTDISIGLAQKPVESLARPEFLPGFDRSVAAEVSSRRKPYEKA